MPSGVRGEARNEAQSEARDDVASDITAEITGAKNYTKYADSFNDENSEEMENIINMKMNVQIGNVSFTAALEDNAATRELIEMMIGKIEDLSGWEEALGSGSITAVFSLVE